MKYLKSFENLNFKFDIGDVVKHTNTGGGYFGSKFKIIKRRTLKGLNGHPNTNLYTLEYYNKHDNKHFGDEFERNLILIPKYELDAEKYNL